MPEIKRRRLIVTDLHPDHFRVKTETIDDVEVTRITLAPQFQIIGNGENPNSTLRDPLDGKVCYASNGTSITRTWVHNGTVWLGS